MKRTNATARSTQEFWRASHATPGAAKMRATVSVLGRFTVLRARVSLRQRLQDHLAHRLQRVEHAVAVDRDRLEVRRSLDPFARWNLLDQVLAAVIRIRHDAHPLRIDDFPPR